MISTETLFDLLDLYTEHQSATIVGRDHDLNTFLGIRIVLNCEASANQYPRYAQSIMEKAFSNDKKNLATCGTRDHCESGLKSVANLHKDASDRQPDQQSSASAKNLMRFQLGTVRFVMNPQRAKNEKRAMADFFGFVEEDESEVEVTRPTERGGERGGERGREQGGERGREQGGERGGERVGSDMESRGRAG